MTPYWMGDTEVTPDERSLVFDLSKFNNDKGGLSPKTSFGALARPTARC